jgi:lysyl-tRNA synthetase class 1
MESRLGNEMVCLDIDFEMYGKDLIESAILSSRIIKVNWKNKPIWFCL